MSVMSVDEERIKELFKEALLELLQERKDVFYDLLAEVFEDLALINAIREGETTDTIDRAEVFKILEGAA